MAKIKDKVIFTGHAQNDLTEFLIFMIDCFHTAIMREVNMDIKGDIQTETDKLAKCCFTMMKTMYKKEYSEILGLFYGIHVSKLETQTGTLIEVFTNSDGFAELAEKAIGTPVNLKFRELFTFEKMTILGDITETLRTMLESMNPVMKSYKGGLS